MNVRQLIERCLVGQNFGDVKVAMLYRNIDGVVIGRKTVPVNHVKCDLNGTGKGIEICIEADDCNLAPLRGPD